MWKNLHSHLLWRLWGQRKWQGGWFGCRTQRSMGNYWSRYNTHGRREQVHILQQLISNWLIKCNYHYKKHPLESLILWTLLYKAILFLDWPRFNNYFSEDKTVHCEAGWGDGAFFYGCTTTTPPPNSPTLKTTKQIMMEQRHSETMPQKQDTWQWVSPFSLLIKS